MTSSTSPPASSGPPRRRSSATPPPRRSRGGLSRYTDTLGIDPLRHAVAKKVSRRTGQFWEPGEIAMTAGAKQALFNAALAILNPGDEVIIPQPYWGTFPAQVKLAGGSPVPLPTYESGYLPRVEDLVAALTPATRAVILNTPNNPTGRVYDRDLLAQLAAVAKAHDIWLLFDECYDEFVHGPDSHVNLLEVAPEVRPRTLIVNAFSKSLALTGWRLGYLAGPKEVVTAVRAIQSHTTSNPNVIAQHAVLAYLEAGDDSFLRETRAHLSFNRTRGLQILSDLKDVPLPAAEGGFYFYLDLRQVLARLAPQDPPASADDIAHRLLAEADVAGVPGNAFGDPTGLRLSYGVATEALERGLIRLVEVMNGLG